jgi:hypothetical protein
LPIIIIYFKIIFCNSKYMQQLKLIRKVSHLFADLYVTPVVKIWARILVFLLCVGLFCNIWYSSSRSVATHNYAWMRDILDITRNTCMQQPLAHNNPMYPVPVLTTVQVRRKR